MRLAWVVLAGCAQNASAPPPPVPRDAAVGVAPPRPRIELLHAVKSTVRVSSRVANAQIHPEDIADKSFDTAWNSRTGELEGAWIDIAVEGAMFDELKLTVGHTGKGPEGEDYFTMNPRIERVELLHAGGVIGTAVLDPNNRQLQSIALPAPMSEVRVRVDTVLPGSNPRWREVCISELEAWGTTTPDFKPGVNPLRVVVGAPANGAIVDLDSACKAPACKLTNRRLLVDPPWLSVGALERGNMRQIVVQTNAGWWPVDKCFDCTFDAHVDHGRLVIVIVVTGFTQTCQLIDDRVSCH